MIDLDFRFAVPEYGVRLEGTNGAFRLAPRHPPEGQGRFYYAHSQVLNIRDHPALFLEFAGLEKTAKAVEVFANKFGTIGLASQDTLRYPAPVHQFIDNITWETDEFSDVGKWLPEIDKMKQAALPWQETGEFPAPLVAGYVTLLSRGTVCHRGNENSSIDLIFVPDRLIDALWVQFFSAVARKAQFRQCEWEACRQWFEVGPGPGKLRSHARFCREKCRKNFHNSMKGQQQ